MAESLHVPRGIISQMLDHAAGNKTQEVCGLLAGSDGLVTSIFPAGNSSASPTTIYEIAPQELFALYREIRAQGLELLGIYHSHPHGENVPSATDIDRAYYRDAAYFIVSPAPDAPRPVRAFRIRDGKVTELLIEEVP